MRRRPTTEPEAAGEALVTLDAEGRVVGATPAAEAFLGPLADVAGRMLAVVDEAAEEERTDRQRDDDLALAALNAVARELATSAEDADVDAALARAACVVTGATGAAVFAEHPEGGLVVTHAAGWNRTGARVMPGAHSGAAHVLATGQEMFAPDAQRDPRLSSANLQQSRAASVAIWPVRIDGRTAGAVLVWWAAPVAALTERTQRLLGMVSDAAAMAIERRAAFGELEVLSRTDPLTGIANRRALDVELTRRLEDPTGESVTLLLLDLDRFKEYNDRFGHLAGDELLRACTDRWAARIRSEDLLSRFGGEEFAVLLHGVALPEALERANVLRRHVPHGQTCSAGVAEWDRVESAVSFVSRADAALYAAKAAGRDVTCAAAAPLSDGPTDARPPPGGEEQDRRGDRNGLASASDLRRALTDGRFELHYQPILEVDSGRITNLEALVRCHGADGRLVPPGEFIALAERTGVIVALGSWVIETACAQIAAWRDEGLDMPVVGINLSPRQLDGPDVADVLAAALARHHLAPSAILVEVTESALISGPEPLVDLLERLGRLGVRCALDDFGKGHSSISRLGALPVGIVKVDRSLVTDIVSSARAARLLHGVVRLVSSVGLDVVIEGIETDEQRRICEQTGARWLQGFLFARPEPADSVAQRFRPVTARPLAPHLG